VGAVKSGSILRSLPENLAHDRLEHSRDYALNIALGNPVPSRYNASVAVGIDELVQNQPTLCFEAVSGGRSASHKRRGISWIVATVIAL